jgi:DNA mismatch repair protein MutL
MYVLFIDLEPAQIDVNVHPTKQEIKFEDEKIVYAFVQAAIKHALAQFSITPTLDFNLDASIQGLDSIQKPFTDDKRAETESGSIFKTFAEANQAHKIDENRSELKHWSLLEHTHPDKEKYALNAQPKTSGFVPLHAIPDLNEGVIFTQLFYTYILVPGAYSFMLIHQQAAHERIIYERLVQAMNNKPIPTQRSLFPTTIELVPADAVMLTDMIPDLQILGYIIEPFGKNAFVIQGTPADIQAGNEKQIIDNVLEQCKHFSDVKLSRREILLRSMALQQAIKTGVVLSRSEMQALVEDLFKTAQPNSTPSGKPVYLELKKDQLENMFGR